jgi:hypothetical protein
MKLPAANKLVVEREKIADYLLNPVHRFGASKARFFTHFGFRMAAWEELAEALREHGGNMTCRRCAKRVSARATRWKVD